MFSILRSQNGRIRKNASKRVLVWLLLALLIAVCIATIIVGNL